MGIWNPWHGCHKISEGCRNCYVYRRDSRYDKDSSIVTKNSAFYAPIERDRQGVYKMQGGETVYACMTSDFFVDDADGWREECWQMIKRRSDIDFMIITKRIHRFADCIPADWGDGYDNVAVCCTVENQAMADFRLPIFLKAPVKHRYIACEPLLEELDLSKYLGPQIIRLVAGGESGQQARPCRYEWVLSLREQCRAAGVGFYFKQTGYRFVKDGKLYLVERKFQHAQARRAGIDV